MSEAQGLVLGWSRCRAVAQTRLASTKMPWTQSAFPQKLAPQAPQAINVTPPRRVGVWAYGPLRLEDAGLGAPDLNAGLPESMSGVLNRLLPEPGHTRPDLCTEEHDRPKCVTINGVATSMFCRWEYFCDRLTLTPSCITIQIVIPMMVMGERSWARDQQNYMQHQMKARITAAITNLNTETVWKVGRRFRSRLKPMAMSSIEFDQ